MVEFFNRVKAAAGLRMQLSPIKPHMTAENIYRNVCKKIWASLVAQMVKNLPVVQAVWVRSLGQEDPLEKEIATHSSILVWRIPWTEEPSGLQFMGSQRVGHD